MTCPWCQNFHYIAGLKDTDWWLLLAQHVIKYHRHEAVGGRHLTQPLSKSEAYTPKGFFSCWCGDFLQLAGDMANPDTIPLAAHFARVGGPVACVLKAGLGLT